MVIRWISLVNNKIDKVCENKKILSIFKDDNTYFYGDYELDIFISSKNDASDIYLVISEVISLSRGWISNRGLQDAFESNYKNLSEIINEFGNVSSNNLRKIFPRRENLIVINSITLRNDGNFKMIACETERFYYVFCFATS